jgi:exosome complex RNA-binding protein Csl4
MATPLLFSTRLAYIFVFLSFIGPGSFLIAEDDIQTVSSPETRTVIAEVLEVEGDFHIVRGERGEIRIEVTPDTQVTEKFTFGDRIKAILLPNDVALMITRAAPDEPIGITSNEPTEPPPAPVAKTTDKSSETDETSTSAPSYKVPKVRIIIANILMVDGSFYIVRTEYGEIQIEITPKTDLSEDFKFGDKIKARVTPTDKALSVVRAGKDEPTGIQDEAAPPAPSTPISPVPTPPTTPTPSNQETPELPAPEIPSTRIIVADVLMVDGDFYIVRGERGEIQIEVTPKTTISESFDYGDRIKAEVLPNDKALTIERAGPDDPIGITTP